MQAAQLLPRGGIDVGAGDERNDVVGMGLRAMQVGDHPAMAQHDDAVCDVEDAVQSVRDEQDRNSLLAECANDLQNCCAFVDTERCGRFIEHENRRVVLCSASDGHQLSLATRQAFDRAIQVGQLNTERCEHLGGSALHGNRSQCAANLEFPTEEEVCRDREVAAQCEILPDDGDTSADRISRPAAQLDAANGDGAAVWTSCLGNAPYKRGLASTILAHDRDDLAGVRCERDVRKRMDRPIALGDVTDFKHAQNLVRGHQWTAAPPR